VFFSSVTAFLEGADIFPARETPQLG